MASSPGEGAASLEERVLAYWSRREAKDLTGAYPFYCLSYRKRVTLSEFLKLTRLVRFDLQNVRIVGTEASVDRTRVTITYQFRAPMLGGQVVNGKTTDAWARDADGQWCKEDEPLALPFPQGPGGASSR